MAVRETETVPKKTTPRVPGPDDWAAARIRHERELRGWSTAELARRVTEAGVPLRQQQVWQIESGEPPRKLSVGEAATIAKIFGLTIADLLTPPESVASQNLINLGRDFAVWRRDAGILAARLREIDERAAQLAEGPEENFTASTVVKFSGYAEFAEQQAAEFDEIAGMYSEIAQSVRDHASVWSLLSSMRGFASDEDAERGPSHGESIRRAERANPPRIPKPGDDDGRQD
jgi:transcriptional regulator with XRE-family HTH domain